MNDGSRVLLDALLCGYIRQGVDEGEKFVYVHCFDNVIYVW